VDFSFQKYFISGGLGFLGSNLVRELLVNTNSYVTVYDNFSNGKIEHLSEFKNNKKLSIIKGEINDTELLLKVMKGHNIVYHLAANSDIASAINNPTVDFDNGTVLTSNILEGMRKNNISRIMYSSGSGVYGEVGKKAVPENYDAMIPISTYGSSKLASECLISAYCFMFGIKGTVLRFANVIGPNQTHGVGYDFIQKLKLDPNNLSILGDGTQSKPYIYISDVLKAFKILENTQEIFYDVYNVGSDDALTVNEIADIVCRKMKHKKVKYHYSGGARGWKADVPYYRIDTTKIKQKGWKADKTSLEAMHLALDSMLS